MAVATDILNAVKSQLEAAFAARSLKCYLRRDSAMNPALVHGLALPHFAVSVNDDRPTRMAWAGKKFVTYTVAVHYFTREQPGQEQPNAEIEETLATAAALFLKPGLTGVPAVSDCDVRPRAPYRIVAQSGTAVDSGLVLTLETIEDAN